MPSTVNVFSYALNVEPTFRLFFAASDVPTSASRSEEFPSMVLPDTRVTDEAPSTDGSSGSFVPTTRIGGTKTVVELPPPNAPPSVPPATGEVRFVVEFELVDPPGPPPKKPPDEVVLGLVSLPVTDCVTETTCGVASIVAMFAAVSGLPPPKPKPPNPAGVTEMVLPDVVETALMRWRTAWSERIMTSASAKLIPRIRTIETVRMVLRKAFFVPRATVPIQATWSLCMDEPYAPRIRRP